MAWIVLTFATAVVTFGIAKFVSWFLRTRPKEKGAKYAAAYTYLRLLRPAPRPRLLDYTLDMCVNSAEINGILPSCSEAKIEGVQELTQTQDVDGVSFVCVDMKGTVLAVRVDKRPERLVEAWLYLRLSDGTQYTLPQHPDTIIHTTDPQSFSAAGIMVECLEPMRRWRVAFNGLLRKVKLKGGLGDGGDYEHVRFSVIWNPSTIGIDYMVDLPLEMKAKIVAREGLNHINKIDTLLRNTMLDRYDQWGVAIGSLTISDNDEQRMVVRGVRTRRIGVYDWSTVSELAEINCYMTNGDGLQLGVISCDTILQKFQYGHFATADGAIHIVDENSVTSDSLDSLLESKTKRCKIYFKSQGVEYSVSLEVLPGGVTINSGENWDCEIQMYSAVANIKGKTGYGIVQFGKRVKKPPPERSHLEKLFKQPEYPSGDIPLTVEFNDARCRYSSVVGGKGASLAILTVIAQDQFIVPRGFCLTTSAYRTQLQQCCHLAEAVRKLDAVLCLRESGSMGKECDSVVRAFSETNVVTDIVSELEQQMTCLFGTDADSTLVAVRSSAVGEDGADLSVAGQHTTYLGVKGLNQIAQAVAKCWGSQFTAMAVQYKRQYGQLIDGGMGVVIMEMVACDVAGVLFTRDPVSGNTETMAITANYGLGESVVSASADPDTILLNRTWDNQLAVKKTTIGQKSTRIIVEESGGTKTLDTPFQQKASSCLSDDLALRLGKIGVLLEMTFGDSRDVEWGVVDQQIYMLQARPLTNLYPETEEELMHEFDCGLITDYEHGTTANVGEVLPGAVSPLTHCTVLKVLGYSLQVIARGYGFGRKNFKPYTDPYFLIMYGHLTFNLLYTFGRMDASRSRMSKTMMEVALFGRIFHDDNLYKVAYERYPENPSYFSIVMHYIYLFGGVFLHKYSLKEATDQYEKRAIPFNTATSAKALNDTINFMFPNEIFKTINAHLNCSNSSTVFTGVMLTELSKAAKGWTPDVFADLAMLLSTCTGVESADVPNALQKMALTIVKDPEGSKFAQLENKEALEWLENNAGATGQAFKDFMKRHGHRCPKEFDIQRKTWLLDPTSLVTSLQNLSRLPLSTLESKKQEITTEEAMRQIKTPLSRRNKWLISTCLPYCRTSVGNREKGKSLLILSVNNVREAYRRLGSLMVEEGRIPDPELIFFMTLWEISTLLNTRTPRILARALKRRRIHKKIDAIVLPEIYSGIPSVTTDATINEHLATTKRITGTPVSQGVVRGIARVVTDLSDAHNIKPNDILITVATDIGWSPFFPMLGGVVTEIGGLISHGAVVAREYGLPCIVGAQTATLVFKSGDEVLLNATKGTIEKIEEVPGDQT